MWREFPLKYERKKAEKKKTESAKGKMEEREGKKEDKGKGRE